MNFSNIVSHYTVCVGTVFQVFHIGVSLGEMHLNILDLFLQSCCLIRITIDSQNTTTICCSYLFVRVTLSEHNYYMLFLFVRVTLFPCLFVRVTLTNK